MTTATATSNRVMKADILAAVPRAKYEPDVYSVFLVPTTEPIFYTVPSLFLEATEHDKTEKHFLTSLCFYLGVKNLDRDDIDSMKEAINNYIVNQVEDWMKEKSPVTIECILNTNFKRLCAAQSFLNERDGTPQIYWKQVLENHVKLIACYSHILNVRR